MNISATEYDVLIIGGGPAGIAAGIWCSELGMSSAIIERSGEVGGQLLNVFNPITNYPGVVVKNGTELRDLFIKNLHGRDCDVLLNSEVVSFDLENLEVSVTGDLKYRGKAIVLATGVRRRRLGVPGEAEFAGKGILYSGAKEAAAVEGKRVLVVGGGDAAVENALILSKFAETVILVHRGTKLSARAEFVQRLNATSNIKILFETEVLGFDGLDKLSSATLINRATDVETNSEIDNALIRIGFIPNSELFKEFLECDGHGFVLVDRNFSTNLSMVFAVGDIAQSRIQTIASAIGTAVIVCKSIESELQKNEETPKV